MGERLHKIAMTLAAIAWSSGAGSQTAMQEDHPPEYLVYTTNEGSGDVSILDPSTLTEIGKIAIGKRPRGLVASPDGATLYVAVSGSPNAGPGVDETKLPPADKSADGIVVIDLRSRRVLRTLRGLSDPEQIAISPDGERLYVASEDSGKLLVIGRDGNSLGKHAVGGQPEGVAVSNDGSIILVTSEEQNTVAILRGTPLHLVGRVGVGDRPRNSVFLGTTRAVVSSEVDATLSVVDARAGRRLRTIKLDPSDRPMGLARIDSHTVLVTTGRGGRLVRIDVDAKSRSADHAVVVGQRPWGLALSPDGSRVFTANGPSNDVTVVDPASMRVIGRISVGKGPWGILAVRTPSRRSTARQK